jgi:hypothetical protein
VFHHGVLQIFFKVVETLIEVKNTLITPDIMAILNLTFIDVHLDLKLVI